MGEHTLMLSVKNMKDRWGKQLTAESTMSLFELGPMPPTLQPWRPAQPTCNPAVLSRVPSAASAVQAHWVLWLVFHP